VGYLEARLKWRLWDAIGVRPLPSEMLRHYADETVPTQVGLRRHKMSDMSIVHYLKEAPLFRPEKKTFVELYRLVGEGI
jgi:hypothetical protein